MVRLKSRVGPLHLRIRVKENGLYTMRELNWNFDNSFKCEVPDEWWAKQANLWLDKTHNLRYKEALTPL